MGQVVQHQEPQDILPFDKEEFKDVGPNVNVKKRNKTKPD
jgi:hypothetical protein